MAHKNSRLLPALIFSSVLVLGACGESDEVNEPVGNESQTEPAPKTGEASPGGGTDEDSIGGETFGFTELSVEAGYPELDDAISIEYEEDRDNIFAEYKNRFTEDDLSGDEAMQQMEQSLQKLELTADTTDEEAITQIVEAFGLEEGYEYIEAEVRYPDGTEKEYKTSGQ
ncbi:YusW family protein [Planococcus sp. FY231025]|uniref:YusW family protein n=1 Tax=Planococcus sp. FY231025 TaxID=3455699 RepID=UPI003F8D9E7E